MRHIPVLLDETVSSLQLQPGTNVIDCTLGDAGHAEAILEKTAPKGKLLGIDADPEAVLRAKRFLYHFEDRVILVRDNFVYVKQIAIDHAFAPVNAIVIDLGWSLPQFEERGRGFSFMKEDEPLDMRYDLHQTPETAAAIVNTYTENDLADLFRQFGEEPLSREVAAQIASARKYKNIETTGELVQLILDVYRTKLKTNKQVPWIGGLHPATKVFQALRIAVNKELDVLRQVLPDAVEILAPGGRLGIITFHSLEDRIVKHYFKSIHGKQAMVVYKKPLTASAEEVQRNPRARSAKLRVIEKK